MPLSYSQISTYKRCPRQYEFAFVKKIPRPISKGESFGASVHNTLKKWAQNYELRSSTGQGEQNQLHLFMEKEKSDPSLPSLEALLALWHQTFTFESFSTRLEADFARSRGEKLMEQFFTWWEREPRTVLIIEKGFSLEAAGVKISGRFDRIEECNGGVRIVDYKTSAPRTQDEVDSDLQLSLYAAAAEKILGKPCKELILLFLYEDEFIERKTVRSPGQIADAAKQIQMIKEQMDSKDFHPLPSVEKCRTCPYRNICDAAAI